MSLPDPMLRALLAALALTLCQCGSDGFFEVISPVSPGGFTAGCGAGATPSVTALEVGRLTGSADDGGVAFAPYNEGDSVSIVRGFQGSDMLVLALRVSGAGGQTCIQQRTDVVDGSGARLSFNAVSQVFTAQPDGTSVTTGIFFPGDYVPGPATVRVTLGGRSLSRNIRVVR